MQLGFASDAYEDLTWLVTYGYLFWTSVTKTNSANNRSNSQIRHDKHLCTLPWIPTLVSSWRIFRPSGFAWIIKLVGKICLCFDRPAPARS